VCGADGASDARIQGTMPRTTRKRTCAMVSHCAVGPPKLPGLCWLLHGVSFCEGRPRPALRQAELQLRKAADPEPFEMLPHHTGCPPSTEKRGKGTLPRLPGATRLFSTVEDTSGCITG